MAFFLRHVNLFATGAKYFNSGGPYFLTHADWQHVLSLTQYPGTDTKGCFNKFVLHESESFGCENKPGMNKSINISSLLINGQIPTTNLLLTSNSRALNPPGVNS